MEYSFSGKGISDLRSSQFVIAAFLPRELDELITPIREKFDPDYDKCAAHITVVFPFETTVPLDQLTAGISEELNKVKQFEVELDSIGDFYPHVPIIYWKVKRVDELNLLYRSLYARLNFPLPHRDYVPHVTVAKEISHHRVMLVKERIVPYLPKERFTVKALDLISPVADQRWVSVRTFPLSE